MKTADRASYDEEDIVVSAFKSFCLGLKGGRFPQLRDRDDLWRLLLVITARKVADRISYQNREKRNVRQQVYASDRDSEQQAVNELFVDREPSPGFAAQCADQLRTLLDQLRVTDLKNIALLKTEGYTNEEIAQQLKRSLATIERKLRNIREIWSQIET